MPGSRGRNCLRKGRVGEPWSAGPWEITNFIKEKLEESLLGKVQLRVKLGNQGWQEGPGKGGRV